MAKKIRRAPFAASGSRRVLKTVTKPIAKPYDPPASLGSTADVSVASYIGGKPKAAPKKRKGPPMIGILSSMNGKG